LRELAEERYEDHVDGYYGAYYGGYYYDDDVDYGSDEGYFYEPPCRSPLVMASGGKVYYVCEAVRYERAYVDGEVVYVIAPE